MEPCQWAFTQVIAALCGGPLLHSPDFSLPFVLQTDVSDRRVDRRVVPGGGGGRVSSAVHQLQAVSD